MEKVNQSCEPMDIDLSNQSVKVMDISDIDTFCDETTPSPVRRTISPLPDLQYNKASLESSSLPIVKKYHIKIQRPPRQMKTKVTKLIGIAVTILISLIAYHVHSMKCCDELNRDSLKETLSSRLYGQKTAIHLLIQALATEANNKILFFYGGTGVGKTLTSSLLLEALGSGSNIYHYTMPGFRDTFSTDLMFGLIMCKKSIIIVDDLTVNDMDIKDLIKTVIEKSANLNKEIIVILIFNCKEINEKYEHDCDKTLRSKLIDNYSEISAQKSYIEFKPLSEVHLRECIKHELGDRKLNNLEFSNVLKHFNVSIDGCKGVHSKMKYLFPE